MARSSSRSVFGHIEKLTRVPVSWKFAAALLLESGSDDRLKDVSGLCLAVRHVIHTVPYTQYVGFSGRGLAKTLISHYVL